MINFVSLTRWLQLLGNGPDAAPNRPRQRARAQAWKARVVLLCLLLCGLSSRSFAAADSKGTDFWLTFPGNYSTGTTLTLFITGEVATTGTVSIASPSFSAPFTVTPGTVTSVIVPAGAELFNSDVIANNGIHVTSGQEVTVYGLNRLQYTTDAYLALPTEVLGTEYINLGYSNLDLSSDMGTQFAVVGTVNGTVVTITPSVAAGTRAANVPYTITLNQGQTYLLRSPGAYPIDLSGTIISSTQPIAVFGSNKCANVPHNHSFCDYLVEQLPPTTAWGKQFASVPLKTRLNGDTFRFLASTNNTQVRVNGALVATLNRGQYHERIIVGSAQIIATEPILVAQYSNGTSFDGVVSDPFMMLITPLEQFLGSYTVTTPATGFAGNYINVVAPSAAVGTVRFDGVVIPAASFSAIGSSGYVGAQLTVSLGTHQVAGGIYPVGVFVYGFNTDDSYGYPGGQSFAPVATVSSLALTPATGTAPTGTAYCVAATIRDQFSAPVVGVRVDFAVSGANATTGFAITNASGVASFCYTGTSAGTDNIAASVGGLSQTVQATYTAATLAPTITLLTPATGPVGTSVTITGTNLSGATAVRFNGTLASSFVVNSAISITAVVAAGTTTGLVTVTTPGGTATSPTNFVLLLRVAPITVPDAYTTPQNVTLTGNVLTNDIGTNPVAILIIRPTHGTLVLNPNGTFMYQPAPGYTGPDSFIYYACDPALPLLCGNPVTVSITVTRVAPITVADAYTTPAGVPLMGNVLTNDIGTNPVAILIIRPTHGVLVLNPNGTFTYQPAAGYTGPDSFTYYACDPNMPLLCGNPVTVSITVLRVAPTTVPDAYTTPQGVLLAGNVLTNDTGTNPRAILITRPTRGTLVLNPDGSFTYQPVASYTGPDSFTYYACDPNLPLLCGNPVTVSIAVLPPPSARVATAAKPTATPVAGAASELALTGSPNPFGEQLRLRFALPTAQAYTLAVYDGQGRLVQQLTSGQAEAGQVQQVEVPTYTYATGLYLVRLTTATSSQFLKLLKQ